MSKKPVQPKVFRHTTEDMFAELNADTNYASEQGLNAKPLEPTEHPAYHDKRIRDAQLVGGFVLEGTVGDANAEALADRVPQSAWNNFSAGKPIGEHGHTQTPKQP